MADNFRIEFKADDVVKLLDDLDFSKGEKKRAIRKVMLQSAKVLKDGVKQAMLTISSKPKRAKAISVGTYKSGLGSFVSIAKGVYLGSGKTDFFSLAFFESGTERKIGSNGKLHGATPARPFFGRGVANKTGAAESIIRSNLLDQIEKIAK